MSIQTAHGNNVGTRPQKAEGGNAGLKSRSEASGEVRSTRRIVAFRPDWSQLKKLENYILGSSAAVITNVSLIVGLGSGQAGKGPIIGGLLTIALADNIADSLGIHLYKESEGCGERSSAVSTALNFISRLLVSLTFIGVVIVFTTYQAIVIAIVWSLALLTVISYLITRRSGKSSIAEIARHVLVAVVAIVLSRCVGYLIAHHSW